MDAPTTSLPATPSNFGEFTQARSSAAESTGGMYQPNQAGMQPQAGGWNEPPKVGKPVDPSVSERTQGADPADLQPDQQPQTDEQRGEQEQLYDENGEPVDMAAYEQQRAEVFQRIQEAIDDGRFPYEELKSLPVDVTVNGETRQVPFEEMRAGYMRTAHFTRQLQQAHGLRDQAQHVLNLERARNAEWRDPSQLRNGLKMLGLEESFMRAAYGWAEERVAYNKLPPRERQLYDQMQTERHQRLTMQQQMRAQQMQAQQQAGPDPATVHAAKQIEQLMPRALRANGVGTYPFAQQKFVENLTILCQDGDITPERANDAARATREFLEDLARMNNGQAPRPNPNAMRDPAEPQQPVRPAYPLGPRRLAGGGPPRQQLTLGSVLGGGQQQGTSANNNNGRRPSDYVRRLGLG